MLCRALLCALMAVGIHAAAAPIDAAPNYVSYQGTACLASDGVTPVTGAADVEFRLYANETDEAALAVWGEVHEDTRFINGVFNVFMGGGEAMDGVPKGALADVFKSAPLWLGIRIGLDAEMTARQRITSVPYALTATHAETTAHGVPAGTIVMFAGTAPPAGWVLCSGQALDSVANPEYAALWHAIQNRWGGADASSFNVPDLQGRTVIGAGAGIDQNTDTSHGNTAGLQSRTVGDTVGAETHVLTVEEMPSHDHSYNDRYIYDDLNRRRFGGAGNAAGTPEDTPQTSGSMGDGNAHNNMQPSTFLNFIIKL